MNPRFWLRLRHVFRIKMSQSNASTPAQQFEEHFLDSAATGNVEEVTKLLRGAVNNNCKNDRGWTALMLAARNGHVNVIKVLLEHGCDVAYINASGQTAKDIASFWNHSDAVAALSKESKGDDSEGQCSNYFSVNPLYRASEQRKNEEWLEKTKKKPSTKFIVFSKLKPFLTPIDGQKKLNLAIFDYGHVASILSTKSLCLFLGLETWDPESSAWFAVSIPDPEHPMFKEVHPDGYFDDSLPSALQLLDTHAGIFAEARSVLAWHDRYKFCPTCGSSTTIADAGYKQVCSKSECRSHKGVNNTCYPRVDPSLIMLVVSPDGKKCLLGRKKMFPGKFYSCLAGFMEPGECIEDTCRREIQEESGVVVGRVEYHSSQPWPFPVTLMLGCVAYAKTNTITVDDDELEDAQWFSRAEVVQMMSRQHPEGFFIPPAQAIAHQLIKAWVTRTANL